MTFFLPLNRFHALFWYFHYSFWTSKCRLGIYFQNCSKHHYKPAARAFDAHHHVVVYTGTPFSTRIETTKCSEISFLMIISCVSIADAVAQRCYAKKVLLKSSAKFTGKRLCQNLFFNVKNYENFIKIISSTDNFLWFFAKFL